MSTSARNVRLGPKLSARAVDVRTSDTDLAVRLEDGRTVAAPLAWFPRLERATPEQRKKWKLIGRGVGIHWPDIDEDISVENLLGADGELLAYRDDAAQQNAAEPVADDPPAARTQASDDAVLRQVVREVDVADDEAAETDEHPLFQRIPRPESPPPTRQ